jgi:hypothetical protein
MVHLVETQGTGIFCASVPGGGGGGYWKQISVVLKKYPMFVTVDRSQSRTSGLQCSRRGLDLPDGSFTGDAGYRHFVHVSPWWWGSDWPAPRCDYISIQMLREGNSVR